jgi:hypothetical protein
VGTRARNLSREDIAAIQRRIMTETAAELAAAFGCHRSTIYKWTVGLDRARRRYAKVALNDRALLAMASCLKQVQIARQLGITPASVCERLKRIRRQGERPHDEQVVRERSGKRGGPRREAA